jgi:hypothetical protein
MSRRVVPAEIYSRVSGYFRPTSQWNKGKKEEFNRRKGLRFSSAPEKSDDSTLPVLKNDYKRI